MEDPIYLRARKITLGQVAESLMVSRQTAHCWVKVGKLPYPFQRGKGATWWWDGDLLWWCDMAIGRGSREYWKVAFPLRNAIIGGELPPARGAKQRRLNGRIARMEYAKKEKGSGK